MTNIKLITDEKQKTAWNKAVRHPLQTWQWGEIKQKNGNQIIRVAIVNDQAKIVQAFLFTVHKLGFNKTIINYAKGVFVPPEVLVFLKQNFGKTAILLKLEPEVFVQEAGKYKVPLLKKHWHSHQLDYFVSNSAVFAKHTFILNLTLPEARLFSLTKSKTRYNIRLAQKKGVEVKDESSNPQGFQQFFRLYKETIKRQNYLGHSQKYHQSVWETMAKQGWAKILVAYYNTRPVSSYLLFMFKDTVYYLYGGSSLEHKEVMASNLLMWESICLAQKLGYTYFDFWGALPNDNQSNHPWLGFHRFKQGYGGVHYSYLPTIDVVFQKNWYRLFSFIWPIRIKILEFKNRFLLPK